MIIFSYGRKPVYSKRKKCSNQLARCEVTKCSADVWKYHMSQHYKECHNHMAFPEELKISEQEKMYVCIQILLKIIDFLLNV